MNLKNLTKHNFYKFILILLISIPITACNTGGSTKTTADESIRGNDFYDPTFGSQATLSWAAPSQREDNQPISLSEIAGYKIYYGTSRRNYSNNILIEDGDVDSYTVQNLESGTYYFALTTIDTDGRESQYSAEIEVIV